MNTVVSKMAVVTVLLMVVVSVHAGTWSKIDDFESGVFDANNWTTVYGAVISDDLVAGTTNKVLKITRENFAVGVPKAAINTHPSLAIAEGQIKTIRFRMATDSSGSRCNFGMSQYADPTNTEYSAQGKINWGTDLYVYDSTAFRTDFPAGSSPLLGRAVWLNVWMVIDNESDTFKVFVSDDGTLWTEPVLVSYVGVGHTKYGFRGGSITVPLTSFAFINDNEATAYPNLYVLFDDIWVYDGVGIGGCEYGETLELDLTGDCYINIEDFAMLAAEWLDCNKQSDTNCVIGY